MEEGHDGESKSEGADDEDMRTRCSRVKCAASVLGIVIVVADLVATGVLLWYLLRF